MSGHIADTHVAQPLGDSPQDGKATEAPASPRGVHFSPDQHDPPLSPLRTGRTRTQWSTASSTIGQEWIPQCVLSFDGGGIRGYSSLLILQKLMRLVEEREKRNRPEADSSYHPGEYRRCQNNGTPNGPTVTDPNDACRFLPCHYFDYIGGTSTGGLISIMLGRLRMGVDEAIAEYENLADEVFGHPRVFSIRGPVPALRNKYSGKKMQDIIENVVTRRLSHRQQEVGGDSFNSPSRLCKTVCVAYGQKPLFPQDVNYAAIPPNPVERNPGAAHRIPIGEVARATSAAPTYFDNITIQNRKFGDGGFGMNNPAMELMFEVGQMNNTDNKVIQILLSIGTGQSMLSRFADGKFKELYSLIRTAKKIATDSERVHEEMMGIKRAHKLPYYRFNVPSTASNLGLGEMKMDEWKKKGGLKNRPESRTTLAKIRRATAEYLLDPNVLEELRRVADILVKTRQERSDTNIWEMVSTGAQYRCILERCPKGMKLRDCEDNLKRHLMLKHNMGDEGEEEEREINRKIEAGKLPY